MLKKSTFAALREMVAAMEEHRQTLTRLDSGIGDSDHGANMHCGFRAALERLDDTGPASPTDALKAVPRALISGIGGAAGPLYDAAFLHASTVLAGKEEISAEDTVGTLENALAGKYAEAAVEARTEPRLRGESRNAPAA